MDASRAKLCPGLSDLVQTSEHLNSSRQAAELPISHVFHTCTPMDLINDQNMLLRKPLATRFVSVHDQDQRYLTNPVSLY